MTTPALLPCPFCGGTDLSIRTDLQSSFAHVVCGDCDAQGPPASFAEMLWEKEDAAAYWNQRSAWQPIETAPRDGTQILAIWPGNGRHGIVWFDRARWTDDGDHSLIDFTHWQPLPSPPPITP